MLRHLLVLLCVLMSLVRPLGAQQMIVSPGTGAATTGVLNVKNFGALGNGTGDDAGAINAAIQALPTTGGVVQFPPGNYYISSSINIIDTTAGNGRKGVVLEGIQGGGSGFSNVAIWWNGATTDPMVKMYSRDNIIRNMHFLVVSGKSTTAAIDIDKTTASGQGNVTNNSFYHVKISGVGGTMTNAVQNGVSNQTNQEYYRFEKCYFSDYTNAGFYQPNTTGQGKHHTFIDVAMSRGAYGVYLASGSFGCYSCGIHYMTTSNFYTGTATDNILIVNTDSEQSSRYFITGGGSSVPWPITIQGGRTEITAMHADGEYIQYSWGGPLYLTNMLFGSNQYVANFKIRTGSSNPPSQLISIGNAFPNTTPYTASSGAQRLISLGNRGINSGGTASVLDDEWLNTNATSGQLRLSTVKGLSAGAVHANNLSGQTTVSSGATTQAVTFGTSETNASYFVQLTPSWNTTAWVTSKGTGGFTINVGTAPGSNSVVDWFIVR